MALGRVLLALMLVSTALVAQAPPLPDEAAFFAEVRKRLASNDLLQSRFSFRERTTELKLNPLGRRLGTGPVAVYDVYPHPDEELTYRRLIERDGRPTSPEELAAQDRQYRERLREWQTQLASEGQSERDERQAQTKAARERDEARAREALDMFTFKITGRDTWEGESAILIGFSPKPDARPRSREGRIARAFAGTAWVHEHEYEVMKVEAKAIDDVGFGFGVIARLHRGSTALFIRRRVDGQWMPVETRFAGTGRAVLLRRVEFKFFRLYEDYRRFEPSDLAARLGWAP